MSGVGVAKGSYKRVMGTRLPFSRCFPCRPHFHPRTLTTSTHAGTTQTQAAAESDLGPLRMHAWQCSGYDGVAGLRQEVVRVPPILRPNDILVKVHAASVNPIDNALISGYGSQVLNMLRLAGQLEQGIMDHNHIEFPITGGRDFVGVVVGCGGGVRGGGVKVGQRVLGVVSPQRQGSHANYVVTPATNVCVVPEGLSSEEAASIPYAALTGWSAAVVSGLMRPQAAHGSRVLVLGAAGGVGSILCQLLSVWGAQVTGVCSGDAEGLVAGLGAEPLDYNDPGTKQMLLADGGYDLVINCAGSDDLEYLRALKPWVGASYVSLSPPLLRNIDNTGLLGGIVQSVKDVMVGNARSLSEGRVYKWAFFMPNPCALSHITRLMATHRIRGVVDKVFPFSQAPEAYSYVTEGHARGKTVITVP